MLRLLLLAQTVQNLSLKLECSGCAAFWPFTAGAGLGMGEAAPSIAMLMLSGSASGGVGGVGGGGGAGCGLRRGSVAILMLEPSGFQKSRVFPSGDFSVVGECQ